MTSKMFSRIVALAALLTPLTAIPHAQAQTQAQTIEAAQVRMLASACANCHGTDGVSQAAVPGLAGRSRIVIASMMKSFKTGSRPATIMHQIAKGYTDDEIDAIAVYFANVNVKK